MNKSESIVELSKALSKFQGEVTSVKKDSINPFFKMKYASLTSVWEHIRAPLSKNGLSVIQVADQDVSDGGRFVLETTLLHLSGEWVSGYLPIKPNKDDPQGVGSAITYARRYALSAILGVVADEDDDGEVAQARPAVKKSEPVKKVEKPIAITKGQAKEITSIVSQRELPNSQVSALIIRHFSVASAKDLDSEQAKELIELLNNETPMVL